MRQLLFFFCLIGLQISAQELPELKKIWMLGGNADIYIERVGGNQGRLIAIAHPGVGYFVAKNFAVGLRTPIGFLSNEYKIGIAPFTRYYFPSKSTTRLFVEINGGYSWRGLKNVAINSYNMEYSWLFGGSGGAAFFINKNVSIDLFLFYSGQNSKTKIKELDMFTEPILKAEIGIGAGFQIFL
jgi:hypothetical protein